MKERKKEKEEKHTSETHRAGNLLEGMDRLVSNTAYSLHIPYSQ
jgi:hypothetical protein